MIDSKLIIACKRNDRQAQRKLYDQLASMLYYTCKRYLSDEHEAQDALTESFFLIFSKINQLKEIDAFVGWAKRITVNHCLKKIRQQVNFSMRIEEELIQNEMIEQVDTTLEHQDLLQLVNQLPIRSKTVFNLYVIEGYSHNEISEKLDIAVGTSKSQLSYAKSKLQELVKNFFYLNNEVK